MKRELLLSSALLGIPAIAARAQDAQPGFATSSTAGLVRPDNVTITVNNQGVISAVSGGGGAGQPGGTTGQLQYNAGAGVFGGFTASGDATVNTSTGAVAVSSIGGKAVNLAGALSTGGGAYSVTFQLVGNTLVTVPMTGTLATTSQLGSYLPLTGGDVTGAVTLGGGATIAGGESLSGGLKVDSVTATGGMSGVTLNLSGAETVGGAASITGGATIGGAASLGGGATISGGEHFDNITVSGAASITGAVQTGAITVAGAMSVTGASTFNGNQVVIGTESITGASTLSGGVYMGSSATITSGFVSNGASTVNGAFNSGAITVTGAASVTGATSLNAITIAGAASVVGAANFGNVITGVTTLTGGAINLSGSATISGNQTVTGGASFGGTISGFTTLSGGAINITGAETVGGALSVVGAETVTGAITAAGSAVIINGGTAAQKILEFTTSGVENWQLYEDATGSGSNLNAARYNSSGTLVDVPISINFSTGNIGLSQGLNVGASATVDGSLQVGTASAGANTLITGVQQANSYDTLLFARKTDTSPTGFFFRVLNAAGNANEAYIDVAGNEYLVGNITVSGAAFVSGGITSAGATFTNNAVVQYGSSFVLDASGNTSFNYLTTNGVGDLVIGTSGTIATGNFDIPGKLLVSGAATIGGALQSSAFTANGSVATAMSSLGPTGSHATIQEWFTVTDSGGNVRYIPAF